MPNTLDAKLMAPGKPSIPYDAIFETSASSFHWSHKPWTYHNRDHPGRKCAGISAFLGTQDVRRMASSERPPYLSRSYKLRFRARSRERYDDAGGARKQNSRTGGVSKHMGINNGLLRIDRAVRYSRVMGASNRKVAQALSSVQRSGKCYIVRLMCIYCSRYAMDHN